MHYIELVGYKEGKYISRGESFEYIACSFQQRDSAIYFYAANVLHTEIFHLNSNKGRRSYLLAKINRIQLNVLRFLHHKRFWYFWGVDILAISCVQHTHTHNDSRIEWNGLLLNSFSVFVSIENRTRKRTKRHIWVGLVLAVDWASSYMRKSF